MPTEARILTLHPDPAKRGVHISQLKYNLVRSAILDALSAQPTVGLTALFDIVDRKLAGCFDGSVSWYVMAVKQDLEARKVIEQVPHSKPQQLRLLSQMPQRPS